MRKFMGIYEKEGSSLLREFELVNVSDLRKIFTRQEPNNFGLNQVYQIDAVQYTQLLEKV